MYRVFSKNKKVADIETEKCQHAEIISNARLIAAAPDLLAALKDALLQFEHNGDESDRDLEVLNRMQAAIAKAEGDQ